MAKEKSAKELSEILSEQIELLSSAKCDNFAIKKSDAIANLLGKSLKLSGLEMAYSKARGSKCPAIPSLERLPCAQEQPLKKSRFY
jgi:hypothetical protein